MHDVSRSIIVKNQENSSVPRSEIKLTVAIERMPAAIERHCLFPPAKISEILPARQQINRQIGCKRVASSRLDSIDKPHPMPLECERVGKVFKKLLAGHRAGGRSPRGGRDAHPFFVQGLPAGSDTEPVNRCLRGAGSPYGIQPQSSAARVASARRRPGVRISAPCPPERVVSLGRRRCFCA